jgi:hypothetical protein
VLSAFNGFCHSHPHQVDGLAEWLARAGTSSSRLRLCPLWLRSLLVLLLLLLLLLLLDLTPVSTRE